MEMIHSHKAGTMHPLLGHAFGTRESEATCNSTDLTGHVLQVPPAPTPTTFPMLKMPTQNSISQYVWAPPPLVAITTLVPHSSLLTTPGTVGTVFVYL